MIPSYPTEIKLLGNVVNTHRWQPLALFFSVRHCSFPPCLHSSLPPSIKEQELTESRGLVDIPALEGSLQSLTDDKRKLDQRVSVLQQELAHISQQSGARGALEALRKDKRNKDDQYQNE